MEAVTVFMFVQGAERMLHSLVAVVSRSEISLHSERQIRNSREHHSLTQFCWVRDKVSLGCGPSVFHHLITLCQKLLLFWSSVLLVVTLPS